MPEHATPTVIAAWLGAVSLTASAEQAATIDVPSSNLIGLIVAHAACETALGTLADPGPPDKTHTVTFALLLERATVAVKPKRPFASHLRRELIDLNEHRNLAVHRRVAVAHQSTIEAAQVARQVIGVLEVHFTGLGSSNAGGLAKAVASMLPVGQVAQELAAAEDTLAAGDPSASFVHQRKVLDLTLSRAHLPDLAPRHVRTHFQTFKDPLSKIWPEVDKLAEAAELDRHWILSLAAGIPHSTIDRLLRIRGITYGPPPPVTVEDATWALAVISEIVYRLFSAGALGRTR